MKKKQKIFETNLFFSMTKRVFDFKELDENFKQNQEKKEPEESLEETKQKQIKSLLDALNQFDFDACKRAYENIFVTTGSFTSNLRPPEESVSEAIDYPGQDRIPGDRHFVEELENFAFEKLKDEDRAKKAFKFEDVGLYDFGAKFFVNPTFFDFDMEDLNAKRDVFLKEKEQRERAAIEKAVPELVANILKIDLDKCFNEFRESYAKTRSFKSETGVTHVELQVPVNKIDFENKFLPIWGKSNSDKLAITLFFGEKRVTARIEAETFYSKDDKKNLKENKKE